MADDFEQQDWVRIGVAGALSRQYAAEQRDFLESLTNMLESALPGETKVDRAGGLFAKKVAKRVTVDMGGNRYALEDAGHGSLRALRTHVVRGIALKSEEIPVQDWLDEVGAALDERAKTSAAARDALARFTG